MLVECDGVGKVRGQGRIGGEGGVDACAQEPVQIQYKSAREALNKSCSTAG